MMKVAVFCPRLPQEAEGNWKLRYQACRAYLRRVSLQDAVEFDTLEYLQIHYPRHRFRRVVVARQGYYPPEFWDWVQRYRVPVLDVMVQYKEHGHKERGRV